MYDKKIWDKIDRYSKKLKAVEYLGGKCEMCGETNIFKLCFHHKDPNEKEFNFQEMRNSRWSKIEKEIVKCVVLCRNCHEKLHKDNDKVNRYKINKKVFLEFKGVNGCEICGYNDCNSSLDFHHLNKNDKDFMIGENYITYNNIEDLTIKLAEELDKCIILCKNCHRIEHTDIDFFDKNKDEITKKSKTTKEVIKKIDRNEIKKLYENGMKQIEISKYFNASKGTISNIIKELGLRNKKSQQN